MRTCSPADAGTFPQGPQLPLPPMLMFDRIRDREAGGEYGKGSPVPS